jgi:hypothetical protein
MEKTMTYRMTDDDRDLEMLLAPEAGSAEDIANMIAADAEDDVEQTVRFENGETLLFSQGVRYVHYAGHGIYACRHGQPRRFYCSLAAWPQGKQRLLEAENRAAPPEACPTMEQTENRTFSLYTYTRLGNRRKLKDGFPTEAAAAAAARDYGPGRYAVGYYDPSFRLVAGGPVTVRDFVVK